MKQIIPFHTEDESQMLVYIIIIIIIWLSNVLLQKGLQPVLMEQ